jgi:SAM-dependent methyltransferase
MQFFLILKALYYYLATPRNLVGREFDSFGRLLGLRLLFHRKTALPLLLNPVSCVRYFEFDYCKRNLGHHIHAKQIIDISSSFLFGFYIAHRHDLKYTYLNPDKREIDHIEYMREYIYPRSKYSVNIADATNLPYRDNSVDDIISISVIEHINGSGDSAAMAQMWRTLKPGGKLILSFPIKRSYEEEFRDDNAYGLNVDKKNGKFFFQRYYDQTSIDKRILSKVPGHEVVNTEIFGELEEGFFEEYEKRWIARGLWETVKDPYYMSKCMRYYDSIDDIRGMAVLGITIKKPMRDGE